MEKIRKIAKDLSIKDDDDAMKRNVNEVETEHQKVFALLKQKEKVECMFIDSSKCVKVNFHSM